MNSRSKGSRLRYLAVGVCLVACLQSAGIFPVFLALAAFVEGSHAVSLSCRPDQISLILHHEQIVEGGSGKHQHGAASQVVCLLGDATRPSSADHVASFTCGSTCEKVLNEFKTKAETCSAAGFDTAEIIASQTLRSFCHSNRTRPAPEVSATLCALRTTVLLI